MSDIVERLRSENSMPPYYGPPKIQVDAADEIERLRAHLKTAIWSDSEECKLLTRINAALLEAPTVDVAVVVPDRDYSAMTPKDCYEAGLLDGVHQAREAIKAATRAALAEEKKGE